MTTDATKDADAAGDVAGNDAEAARRARASVADGMIERLAELVVSPD